MDEHALRTIGLRGNGMAEQCVGMIGLGLMGLALVKRLKALGLTVAGCDLDATKCAAAQDEGAEIMDTPAAVATRVDTVLISVTTTANVVDVVSGENGLLSAGSPCAIVDLSTTEMDATLALARLADTKDGFDFVDSPVSGGPPACEAGTLAIMAGGHDDAIARVRPVMDQLGTFTHMGPSGAGQATKLINQTLVLNNFILIAEAMRLAEAYDVDASRIPDALAQGYAGSNLLPVALDRMIRRDWTPTGYARQVLKDLDMVIAAGKAQGLAQPMTTQAATLYRMMVGAGQGEIDGTAILELLPEPKPKAP